MCNRTKRNRHSTSSGTETPSTVCHLLVLRECQHSCRVSHTPLLLLYCICKGVGAHSYYSRVHWEQRTLAIRQYYYVE